MPMWLYITTSARSAIKATMKGCKKELALIVGAGRGVGVGVGVGVGSVVGDEVGVSSVDGVATGVEVGAVIGGITTDARRGLTMGEMAMVAPAVSASNL